MRIVEKSGLFGLDRRVVLDLSKAEIAALERARDIADQLQAGQSAIIGVMLESHLVAGAQTVVPGQALTYGQSITDGCIAFEDTVQVLQMLARAVEARRAAAAA